MTDSRIVLEHFGTIARVVDFHMVFGQRAINVTNNYLDCYLR